MPNNPTPAPAPAELISAALTDLQNALAMIAGTAGLYTPELAEVIGRAGHTIDALSQQATTSAPSTADLAHYLEMYDHAEALCTQAVTGPEFRLADGQRRDAATNLVGAVRRHLAVAFAQPAPPADVSNNPEVAVHVPATCKNVEHVPPLWDCGQGWRRETIPGRSRIRLRIVRESDAQEALWADATLLEYLRWAEREVQGQRFPTTFIARAIHLAIGERQTAQAQAGGEGSE